jgi:hypothetical protein
MVAGSSQLRGAVDSGARAGGSQDVLVEPRSDAMATNTTSGGGEPGTRRRGDPRFAALLTWFAPGAGHLYLGMPIVGLVAFVVVQGLFFIGLKLSGGMLLEYLEPDLQGPFAAALTPEAANLGMLVYQMKSYAFGVGVPRVWPEFMHLGVTLTALSGLLNAFLMVQAISDARRTESAPRWTALPVLLTWIVPGLGHWQQGRKLRAAVVFTSLVGLFVLGTLLAEGSNLDRERHFYYWAGQFLVGGPALIAEILHGHALITRDIAYVDGGLGMTCVAGLLNVLAMIDVYNHAERDGATAAAVSPATPRPAPPSGTTQPGSLA